MPGCANTQNRSQGPTWSVSCFSNLLVFTIQTSIETLESSISLIGYSVPLTRPQTPTQVDLKRTSAFEINSVG